MLRTLDTAPAPFRGTEVHTLGNGLQIVLKPDPTVPVVALQAWARCGAIDESPNIYGISHGLEHMVFKGTPTRTAGQITRQIEAQGGAINAATQLETTHYYIDVPSTGLLPALDVLADTILHPTFPEDELERERKVILEEIHRRDDSPEATLWDEFCSQVFEGTPYGIKVIGSEQTVSAMSRKDLADYYRRHYVPSKMAIVVAGDFDQKKVLARLKRHFGHLKGDAPETPPIVLSPSTKPRSIEIEKPVQVTYFAVGTPAPGLGSLEAVGLDLLADVLSGGTSARFYQRLREEQEAVLSLSCDYIPFQQHGLFSFFGEAQAVRAERALDLLFEQIAALKVDPIREPELQRAKARIKSEWLYGSETPHGQANTLGSLTVLGRLDMIVRYLERLDALTPDDVMDLYHRYVADRPFHRTIVRPGAA